MVAKVRLMLRRMSILFVVLAGCGQSAKEDTIAQAFTIESKQEKEAEALAAKQAENKAKEDEVKKAEQAKVDAAIDAAAQLPAELPADLGTACDAVVNAYDEFMKNGPERDALLWSDGRRQKLGDRKAACVKVGKIKVAACEAEALRAAPAELADQPRKEAARHLMERCHDKFG